MPYHTVIAVEGGQPAVLVDREVLGDVPPLATLYAIIS